MEQAVAKAKEAQDDEAKAQERKEVQDDEGAKHAFLINIEQNNS